MLSRGSGRAGNPGLSLPPPPLISGVGFGESLQSLTSALRSNTVLKNVASFSSPLLSFSFFLAELEKCIQEQDRLAQLFIKHVSASLRLPSPCPPGSSACVLEFLLSSALPSHPSLSCCSVTSRSRQQTLATAFTLLCLIG